jgi:hypothetical protein
MLVGLAFVVALTVRIEYVNGPWYWSWPWRSISLLRGLIFLGLPFLPYYYVVRRLDSEPDVRQTRAFLAMLAATMFSMTILGILADPSDPGLLLRIIRSPSATSYYSDALKIENPIAWLSNFHRAELELHSSTHPPGPILFYYLCLALFGTDAGGIVGAGVIAAWAALGVPVLFRFAALWTPDPKARLAACALYSMLPGLLLFFPCFDAVYPVFSMLLFLFWAEALGGKEWRAIAFGATLFLSTLLAYNLLAAGSLLLLHTLRVLRRSPKEPATWIRLARVAGLGLAAFCLLHVLLWVVTGYKPVHSFLHALSTQGSHAEGLGRPYLACLGFDLYDFALGGGILPAVLLGFFLLGRPGGASDAERSARVMATVGILGILAVDLTGLLRCETARVWLFLQPWVVLPAALELRDWAPVRREAVFCLQWVIIVVVKCNLGFVWL